MKVFFLGSSITYGYAAGGYSFADYVNEHSDYEVVKEAVSGTTLSSCLPDSYYERLLNRGTEGADVLLVQLSTNDASKGVALGGVDSIDPKTSCGAINRIIEFGIDNGCRVGFYATPVLGDDSFFAPIEEAMEMISAQRGVPFLDLNKDENLKNLCSKPGYYADNIHPSAKGHAELLGPGFLSFIKDLQ